MSAIDTVKDAFRIASQAGLSQDVIDLLDKKVALLNQQIATIEKDNAALASQNAELTRENRELQQELDRLSSQTTWLRKGVEHDPLMVETLKAFLLQPGSISNIHLARYLKLPQGVVDEHIDSLLKKKFIVQTRLRPSEFQIRPEGRAFLVEHKLMG